MREKIIENIKRELKDRQSNINKLCRTLGVNRNYINQLRDNTPVSKLKKISDAIGCNLSNLFVGVQPDNLFLLIPFFRNNKSRGVKGNTFRFHIENATVQRFSICWFYCAEIQFEIRNQFAKIEGGGCFFYNFCTKNFSRPNNYI